MHTPHHFETQIAKVYDYLYANADERTPEAIEREVMKILKTGVYLETELNSLEPAFKFDQKERSILEKDSEAQANYAEFIRKTFCAAVKAERPSARDATINLSDYDLVHACLQFSGITLNSKDRDVFGDAVELFRSHWSKYQGGQFFTDQRVTDLALELLEFDGNSGERFVDLCAGTGGFIISAIKRQKKLGKKPIPYSRLFGFEVDQAVAKIGNQSLRVINGCRNDIIQIRNSLTIDDEKAFTHAATNPPFGAKIRVKDPAVLGAFSMARQRTSGVLKPLPLDILFIEKNFHLLAPEGRLAIVLPFQTLSGPQARWVREWVIQRFKLLAVVDLPPDTFQPYTGTKASLVLLEKFSGGISSQSETIFMSCPAHIGHNRRGNPMWKKNDAGVELDEILTDFPLVTSDLRKWRSSKSAVGEISPRSFAISPDRICESSGFRFDARLYQPTEFELTRARLNDGKRFSMTMLGQLCETIFYPGRFKRNYTEKSESSVPFLGGTNISQLLLVTDKYLRLDDRNYDQLRVKPGWILMTRSGSTGIVSSVPQEWDGFAISEHVIRIVPDKSKISLEYLLAYLNSEFAKAYIRKGVFGSVIDELSPEYIGNMPVYIPREREEIAAIEKNVSSGLKARNRAIDMLEASNEMVNKMLG